MPNREVGRVEMRDYEGHPIIDCFLDGDSRPFGFGLRKAEKVLANVEAIREFVDKHRNPAPEYDDVNRIEP